jgi:hypothetical protein
LTPNEFQTWLATLTPEQRHIADTVIRVYADALLMLEGRMARLEEAHKHLLAGYNDHDKRITALEEILDDIINDELDVIVDLEEPRITSAA